MQRRFPQQAAVDWQLSLFLRHSFGSLIEKSSVVALGFFFVHAQVFHTKVTKHTRRNTRRMLMIISSNTSDYIRNTVNPLFRRPRFKRNPYLRDKKWLTGYQGSALTTLTLTEKLLNWDFRLNELDFILDPAKKPGIISSKKLFEALTLMYNELPH